MAGETKVDSSFPESQFLLEGMKKPYRLDVSAKTGAKLVVVNKDVPSKYNVLNIFKDLNI